MSENQMIQNLADFQVYDLLPLGVCVIDETLTVHEWNQRFEEWTGIYRETAIGMNLGQEYPHLLSNRFSNRLQGVFATSSPVVFAAALHKYFIPIRLGTSDDLMFQQTLVRSIPDGSGRALVIIQDVTSQYRQQKELRQERARLRNSERELEKHAEELVRSNSELEQFAHVVSHDLKEPLRAVTNYAQLLADEYADQLDDDAQKYIHYTTDGAIRMQRLIDDLLNYSRVGRNDNDLQPINLQNIIESSLQNLGQARDESNAQIQVDPLPTILANETNMVRLFQNLIGNALKFRGDEPVSVHVHCEPEGEMFHFAVTDNGIGIKPKFHKNIFDIFQRLHSRSQYEGTGIGLAICKKIVEQLGGRIWVESEPGRGTTFHFTLPNPGDSVSQPTRQEVQLV